MGKLTRLMTFGKAFGALSLAFVLISGVVFAQDSPKQNQDDVIRVETNLIPFDVTVTDAGGKFVRGLKAADFKLYEDGKERKIDFFEETEKRQGKRPLAVVFLLDISGSVTPEEISKLREAMQVFLDNLADYESVFAIQAFGMNVKTLQGFTNKPDRLEGTFQKLLREPNGLSTHTYDALDDAVRLLARKAPKIRQNQLVKRAVIVVTDGFPVGDVVSPKTVIERANQAETSIYTVILPSYSKLLSQKNGKPLPTPLDISGVTEKTGGASLYANEKSFAPIFRALAADIQASYVLAFYPAENEQNDTKFRTVRIETKEGFSVRQNRNGYQLPKQ